VQKYGTVIEDYNSLGTQNKPGAQRNQWLLPNNTPNLFGHNTPPAAVTEKAASQAKLTSECEFFAGHCSWGLGEI
jgi:hypothetical protein